MPTLHDKREAAEAASRSSVSSTRKRGKSQAVSRQRFLVCLSVLLFLGAAARLSLVSPAYQEWRYRHLSLDALAQERANRLDNPRLLYYTGLRLNQQGRFAEADPLLRNAVGLDPDSPRLRDEWARALLGSGLTTAAFGQLSEFAGTHSNLAAAHFILGKFYFVQRSMKRANEELERTVTLDAKNDAAWAYLAQTMEHENPRARQAVEHAVALRPDSARYHLLYAGLLAQAGDSAAARREYARAASLAPHDALAHQEYAAWLLRAGAEKADLRLAEEEAGRAIAIAPGNALAHLACGRARAQEGRDKDAIAPLLEAANRDSALTAPALELAQAYRRLRQTAEAASWQRQYIVRQSYAENVTQIVQALRVHPDSRDLHARLAALVGRHGDVNECVRQHGMALHLAPDAPRVQEAACDDLLAGGHAELALPLAQRAVEIGDNSSQAHLVMGNVLLALDRYDEAVTHYIKAARLLPSLEPILRKRLKDYVAAHPAPVTPSFSTVPPERKSKI